MNLYKFNDEGGKHEHLLWSERKQEFEQLTGATTIVEVLGKVLTWWASGLAVSKFGWTNGKTATVEQRITHLKPIREEISALDDSDYLSLLDDAYKAHSVRLTDSAQEGTDLHAELEKFVKNQILLQESGTIDKTKYDEKIHPFIEWSKENVKKFIWSEGYCYDELLFVGGISDCGAELKDGSYAIIDFKSAKEAYFNHFVQIGIYNLLIEKNGVLDKEGNRLVGAGDISKYIVVPFGAKEFKVVESDSVKGLKEAAKACITLYRQKSSFENK